MQVTYNRHPLYTFVLDKQAGQTKGQGSLASGGRWWAVSASGTAIVKRSDDHDHHDDHDDRHDHDDYLRLRLLAGRKELQESRRADSNRGPLHYELSDRRPKIPANRAFTAWADGLEPAVNPLLHLVG